MKKYNSLPFKKNSMLDKEQRLLKQLSNLNSFKFKLRGLTKKMRN